MNFDQLKNSKRLNQILQSFIDVLRINILIVDSYGRLVLMPSSNYGAKLLGDSFSGVLHAHQEPLGFLNKFTHAGGYLKRDSSFSTQCFAIPIGFDQHLGYAAAYLLVGPIILNKRLEKIEYEHAAQALKKDTEEVLEILDEVRVLSFNNLGSILSLLSEISDYALKQENDQMQPKPSLEDFSIQVEQLTKEMNALMFQENFLSPLLDITLAVTKAESGSIMVFNDKTDELIVTVSRGMDENKIYNTRIKMGEGIAGLAAQHKTSFILDDTPPDNRIKHLLKRPEIKQSMILPLVSPKNDVLGVLNISTQREGFRLASNSSEILRSLSKLTSAALQSMAK